MADIVLQDHRDRPPVRENFGSLSRRRTKQRTIAPTLHIRAFGQEKHKRLRLRLGVFATSFRSFFLAEAIRLTIEKADSASLASLAWFYRPSPMLQMRIFRIIVHVAHMD